MSGIKKVILGIVGVVLAFVVGSMTYAWFLIHETKTASAQFCDGVTSGEEIGVVLARAIPYGPYKVWFHDQDEKFIKAFDKKSFGKLKTEKLTNEVVSVVFRASVPPTCTCKIKLEQGKILSKSYSVLD